MKRFILVVIVALTLALAPTNAKGADIDRLLFTLCETVAEDNRSKMRKKLKAANLRLRNIYSKIGCNGHKLYTWAKMNDAAESMKFIETKMKDKIADEL